MVSDVLVCDEINQLDDAVDAAKQILHRAAIAAHHARKMVEEHDERVRREGLRESGDTNP